LVVLLYLLFSNFNTTLVIGLSTISLPIYSLKKNIITYLLLREIING